MGKVETYSSLEEKSEAFEQITIKTKDQLDEFIAKYKENDNENLLFRGCKEAHYKLYNKAQREWIEKELTNLCPLYERFILNVIKNVKAWQNNLIVKFFLSYGQPVNDLIILGFLQHYGAPTPLLDWTYRFDNSLFFATDNLTFLESDNEIDAYFSIYVIDNSDKNIPNHIENVISYAKHICYEDTNYDKLNKLLLLDFLGSLSYWDLKDEIIALIPGYCKNGIAHKIEEYSFKLFYNQPNLNIINQQGIFIFTASEDKPLEYYFKGVPVQYFVQHVNYHKITCLNIHKSLFEYVKLYLAKQTPFPINKEFIYPQEELIAKKAYQQFLNFDNLNNE